MSSDIQLSEEDVKEIAKNCKEWGQICFIGSIERELNSILPVLNALLQKKQKLLLTRRLAEPVTVEEYEEDEVAEID